MKIAFVFPGQGSQFIGMGKELRENFLEAREVFEEVDESLKQNLSALMFEGDIEELTKTINAQPAIMAISYAAVCVMKKQLGVDIARDACFAAGHSLGEYSALLALQAITLKQASNLLRIRGSAMQAAAERRRGGMIALLGAAIGDAEKLAQEASQLGVCQVANDNGAEQVVLSGELEAIDKAIELAGNYPIRRAVKLNVSGAFHSELMQPAEEGMHEALRDIELLPLANPVIPNFTAQPTKDPLAIKDLLCKQICNRVRWRETIGVFEKEGITHIIEVGPGRVLSGIAKKMLPDTQVANFCAPAELEQLAKILGR